MEKKTSSINSGLIFNNIKHEPSAEFVLILPNGHEKIPTISVRPIKVDLEGFSIKLRKFDLLRKHRAKFFKSFYVCRKCEKVIAAKGHFDRHSRRCNTADYQCDLCPFSNHFKDQLGKHMKYHFKFKYFYCYECGEGFRNRAGVQRHIKRMRLYRCSICSINFKCRYGLKKHDRSVHANMFKCDQCPYVGKTKKYLTTHKYKHKQSFSCETCAKKLVFAHQLKDHQMVHKHGNYATAPEVKFSCDKCKKSYATANCLNNHKNIIHASSEAQCDFCAMVFQSKHYLRQHIHVHFKIPCKVCKKKISKRNFTQHKASHQVPFPYRCDLCGRNNKTKRTLRQHILIHAAGKFYCALCKKTFGVIEGLEHKKVHIGPKDYKCLHCAFRATANCYIKNHVKTAHK